MRWLKAALPLLVLGLSLVMMFLAFYQASPPFPPSISQDRHSALFVIGLINGFNRINKCFYPCG